MSSWICNRYGSVAMRLWALHSSMAAFPLVPCRRVFDAAIRGGRDIRVISVRCYGQVGNRLPRLYYKEKLSLIKTGDDAQDQKSISGPVSCGEGEERSGTHVNDAANDGRKSSRSNNSSINSSNNSSINSSNNSSNNSSINSSNNSSNNSNSGQRRFEVPATATIGVNNMIRLDEEETQHACTVLRLQAGDKVEVCDGYGTVLTGTLLMGSDSVMIDNTYSIQGSRNLKKKKQRRRASVAVDDVRVCPQPHVRCTVVVACGSLKGGRGDWLVEKCAEIGATEFIPLKTKRSPKIQGNDARQERICWAALKQSLQAWKMMMHPPLTVEEFSNEYMSQIMNENLKKPIILLGEEGAPPVHRQLSSLVQQHTVDTTGETRVEGQTQQVYLCIGPEGDFTEEEREYMRQHGAVSVGLGSHRLRTETAAISLLSYVRLFLDR